MKRFLAAWLMAFCLLAGGCAQDLAGVSLPRLGGERASDQETIAAILDDVHRGMESKRIYKVLAHLSRNYDDTEGRDYEAMRDYLSSIMRGYRHIRVTRTRPRIIVVGDRARAVEAFGTIAEPYEVAGGPPINLQGHVAVYFERAGGQWKIVEWGPLL